MKKILLLLTILACNYCQAQTQFVNDPSFEATGAGGNAWKMVNGYDPLVSMLDAPINPHSGNYVALLIGYSDTGGTSYLYQQIVNLTTRYNCKLEFWIRNVMCSGSSNDVFAVSLDTTFLDLLNAKYKLSGLKTDSISIGTNWKKITINIDTLKPGIYFLALLSSDLNTSNGMTIYEIDDITFTTGYPTAIHGIDKPNIINIYPTIVADNISLELLNTTQQYTTSIYNTTGQFVQQNILNREERQSLAINNIQAGTYVLQVKDNSGAVLQTQRFIKQ
jgi:hypothetical protein